MDKVEIIFMIVLDENTMKALASYGKICYFLEHK